MMQNVRMKKSELFQLLDSLRIDRNEFWVVSSGALVLRGILDDAGDLDIVVTKKGLEELTKNYNIIKKGVDKYFVQENIESVAVVEKEDVSISSCPNRRVLCSKYKRVLRLSSF